MILKNRALPILFFIFSDIFCISDIKHWLVLYFHNFMINDTCNRLVILTQSYSEQVQVANSDVF